MHKIKVLDCSSTGDLLEIILLFLFFRDVLMFLCFSQTRLWGYQIGGFYSRKCVNYSTLSFCTSIPKARSSVSAMFCLPLWCWMLHKLFCAHIIIISHSRPLLELRLNVEHLYTLYYCRDATIQQWKSTCFCYLFFFCFLLAKFFNEARAGKVGGRGR
jgi:hypothetical protein